MNSLVILLVVVPFLGSVLTLGEKLLPRLRIASWASAVSLTASAALLFLLYPEVRDGGSQFYRLGEWPPDIGIALIMDGLSWIGCLAVLLVGLPALFYVLGEGGYSATFYFFFLMTIGAMFGLILTEDIFNMFVFMEILALSSFVLIAYRQKPRALVASFNYLLTSSLGISFFLFGVFILYRITGTLSLTEMGPRLGAAGLPGRDRSVTVALTCLIAGIGVRVAFVPFHFWLPEAHARAPHPVSALLSGVLIKVSFVSLWRILRLVDRWDLGELFLWTGAVTAALGVAFALAQRDVKRLLAFHSVSQIGYILAAFGAANTASLLASAYHLLNHALFKSLLFLTVGTVITACGERNLEKLGRLGTKLPLVALPFLMAALSIAGVPPFSGYVSKQLISLGLKGHPAYPLIWIAGFGTAASFLKLSAMFRPKRGSLPEGVENPAPPPKGVYPSLWFLGILCLGLGLFPRFWIERFAALLAPVLPPGPGSPPDSTGVYSSSGLWGTLLMLGLGLILYFGVVSEKGKKAARLVRMGDPGLETSLLLLLGGFVVFSLASF